MPRGGYRPNAGRKPGIANQLTQELRDKIKTVDLIKFLQNLAGNHPNDLRIVNNETAFHCDEIFSIRS